MLIVWHILPAHYKKITAFFLFLQNTIKCHVYTEGWIDKKIWSAQDKRMTKSKDIKLEWKPYGFQDLETSHTPPLPNLYPCEIWSCSVLNQIAGSPSSSGLATGRQWLSKVFSSHSLHHLLPPAYQTSASSPFAHVKPPLQITCTQLPYNLKRC